MTNSQKANVWIAALDAAKVSGLNFGGMRLIARDVAHELGLVHQFDEKDFCLHAKKQGAYPAGKLLRTFPHA